MLAELKDKVLNYLIDTTPLFGMRTINVDEEAEKIEVAQSFFSECIKYFSRKGLLEYQAFMGGEMLINFKMEAHDFAQHGGFVAEEEMLGIQFEKLLTEVKALKSQIGQDKFDKITGIMTAITAYYSTFILGK